MLSRIFDVKINDRFAIEPAAFEVAQRLYPSDEREQRYFFGTVREAMTEAYDAGRRSMTITGRLKRLIAGSGFNLG